MSNDRKLTADFPGPAFSRVWTTVERRLVTAPDCSSFPRSRIRTEPEENRQTAGEGFRLRYSSFVRRTNPPRCGRSNPRIQSRSGTCNRPSAEVPPKGCSGLSCHLDASAQRSVEFYRHIPKTKDAMPLRGFFVLPTRIRGLPLSREIGQVSTANRHEQLADSLRFR